MWFYCKATEKISLKGLYALVQMGLEKDIQPLTDRQPRTKRFEIILLPVTVRAECLESHGEDFCAS